jgi:hypothetical protein
VIFIQAGDLPDRGGLDEHAVREMREVLADHGAAGGRHEPAGAPMRAVLALIDDVEGGQVVVLIALPTFVVDGDIPLHAIAELSRAILEHPVDERRILVEFVSVNVADHGFTLLGKDSAHDLPQVE